jgi:hypothetical protein
MTPPRRFSSTRKRLVQLVRERASADASKLGSIAAVIESNDYINDPETIEKERKRVEARQNLIKALRTSLE